VLHNIVIEWETSDGMSVQSVTVNGFTELQQYLMALGAKARMAEHPIIAIVTMEDHTFSIGLGSKEGALLTYDGYQGNPPYFVVVGDDTRTGMEYFLINSSSEIPLANLIPLELAISALIDSLKRRAPSPMIKWDEC
jgi:hypothetical protein